MNRYQIRIGGWDGNQSSSLLTHTHLFTKEEFKDYVRTVLKKVMEEYEEKYKNEDGSRYIARLHHYNMLDRLEKELIESHQFAIIEDNTIIAYWDENCSIENL